MTFNVQFNKVGEPNYPYVYEIMHKPTDSVYVGASEANKKMPHGYWGSACGKSNQLMHRKTILKNIDNYQKTILMYFNTYDEALKREEKKIEEYLIEYGNLCLNRHSKGGFTKAACAAGGKNGCRNGMLGKTHSEATKQQMQQSAIASNTPAVRLKKSKGLKGKKKTVEHCQNLSTAIQQKGSNKNKVSKMVWCTDGCKNRRIKPVDLNQFLKDNPTFREGQVFPNRKKLTHTEEHKEYLRQKAIEKNKALGHF